MKAWRDSHVRSKSKVCRAKGICPVIAGLVLLAVIALGFASRDLFPKRQVNRESNKIVAAQLRVAPGSLIELLALAPNDLNRIDIGLMNLLCAEGLRGAEELNVKECLARLDGMASKVEFETRRHLYRFNQNPSEFNNSEAYFRMLMLAVVMQDDFHVGYNPQRITSPDAPEANDVFFADSRDSFLHGLLAMERRLGTCSSLPVLYVAIGRRLNYPLKLVSAKNHLFVRWEDDRSRFNVDATTRGLSVDGDDRYRAWPLPITAQEEKDFGYLKSLSAAEELSVFLSLRGHCLMAAGRTKVAIGAFEQGVGVTPASRLAQVDLKIARAEATWKEGPARAAVLDALDPTLGLPANNERRARELETHLPPGVRARLPQEPTNPLMRE